MFDDSKRLDKLEGQMNDLMKSYSSTVTMIDGNMSNLKDHLKAFQNFDTDISKRLDDAINGVNDHVKRIDKLEADLKTTKDGMAKILSRLSAVEAAVKKIK